MSWMGQSREEVVKVFFPMARVTFHAGGSGADSIIIGSPRIGTNNTIGGYDCLSKTFPLNTDHSILWNDAYDNLVERAKYLVKSDEIRNAAEFEEWFKNKE